MLTLADISFDATAALLARYGLALHRIADGEAIPGSYWGECEAGLIGHNVYARGDTPVHSLLHEAAHLIVLPPERRAQVHTDATDSIEEEDAVCVLQALLGDALPGVGRERVLADMDGWGYVPPGFGEGVFRTRFRCGMGMAACARPGRFGNAFAQRARLTFLPSSPRKRGPSAFNGFLRGDRDFTLSTPPSELMA